MTSGAAFGINGRFLNQPVTGVQRYARNVMSAMNASMSAQGIYAPIIAPSGTEDPALSMMPLTEVQPFGGHLWEQMILPARWHGPLLNLCNTAPATKSEQVVCIHDANVFVAPESYSPVFRAFYSLLHRRLAANETQIATVSHFSASQIARYLPVSMSKIAVLPNGHEHALAWDPNLAKIAPLFLSDSATRPPRRFVLALGSQARHKNLKLLLDAAPGLAAIGIDVVIAGGGAGIFADEHLPSASNVTLLGYVTDHDLAYLMDQALCLVFPSWTEGFGLPIVEAMARGCPVISSNRASMPEVCGNAALLAPPDDLNVWLQQVTRLAGSNDLRRELIERGHERVKLFSWTNTAAGYIDLMSEPSQRPPRKLSRDSKPLPNIAVVVATCRRPDVVTSTLTHLLATQTLAPVTVIVSCITASDAGGAAAFPGVQVVTGPLGLAAQRNTALAALPDGTDIVAFFDDDFVADADWLKAAAQAFCDEPDLVGFTGGVLADGILGPGLSFDEAVRIVDTADSAASPSRIEPYSPYGCNMAFRLSAVGDLKFDERLVLYGWLEDRDFGGALKKRGGRLVKCTSARGVHMGVKSGRVAGDRLGYSQIVNPIYLLGKGTMSLGQVAKHISRNVISNLVHLPKPEPFIDRRGRLRGNLRAFGDIMRGRIEPERAIGSTT